MISSIGFNHNRHRRVNSDKDKKKKKASPAFSFETTELDEAISLFEQPTPQIVVNTLGLSNKHEREMHESDYEYIKRMVTETPEIALQNITIHEFTAQLDRFSPENKLNDIIIILYSAAKTPRPGSQLTQLSKGFTQLLRLCYFNVGLTQKILTGITDLYKLTVQIATILQSKSPSPTQLHRINESLVYQTKVINTLFKVLPKQYPFDQKMITLLIKQTTNLYRMTHNHDIQDELIHCFYNLTLFLLEKKDTLDENLLYLMSNFEEFEGYKNKESQKKFLALLEKISTYFNV